MHATGSRGDSANPAVDDEKPHPQCTRGFDERFGDGVVNPTGWLRDHWAMLRATMESDAFVDSVMKRVRTRKRRPKTLLSRLWGNTPSSAGVRKRRRRKPRTT